MPLFFKKTPLSIITLATLSLLALGAQAQNVIPYQGTLFSQGQPVSQSAPIKMAFALYCCNTSGLQAEEPGISAVLNRKWSSWGAVGTVPVTEENMIDVIVRNGRFLVHLGETERGQVAISDIAFDERPLYVVTWIAQPLDGGEYRIFRLPPQKLATVPHAVTARRANGFEVMGTLKVDTIQPNQNAEVNVSGVLTVLNRLKTNLITGLTSNLTLGVGDVDDVGCPSGSCGEGLKIVGGGNGSINIDTNESFIQGTGHTVNSDGGRINFALPIQFNGGTVLTKLAFGVKGNCGSNDSAGDGGTINFGTFSSPPIVILTPYDSSGCTTVRLTGVTTTSASYQSWHTNNLAACNCIYWAALGN